MEENISHACNVVGLSDVRLLGNDKYTIECIKCSCSMNRGGNRLGGLTVRVSATVCGWGQCNTDRRRKRE